MYKSLQHFIDRLESEGELIRISRYVNPELEIAEITDRISKQPNGGKAILFENTGTQFPVITNMMGSTRRICMALGVDDLDEFGELMRVILGSLLSPKKSIFEKMSMLPELSQIASWMPKLRSGCGICQQVICKTPDLSLLPILKCWPCDGGPFVTLPMVHTKNIETGVRNVGMYRMQVVGPQLTGMHWHKHKTGARHFEGYKKYGERMPVAVTIGGDPAYTYAATAPMPEGIDEYMLAGFIRSKKVELVKCLTVDIEVPADVDFVIEGYVDPAENPIWEGPFGDHTGFYSLADWYPSFHVTCITHRKNAIYPATVVGVPPMEDAYIAKATERIFIEPIRATMLPELVDMDMPVEGVAHNITLISIDSSYEGQAYKAMNTLWGAGQMMFNKILIAFSADVDLRNYMELAKHVVRCLNPQRDLFFGRGIADVLDHATDICGEGSKVFIDATASEQYSITDVDIAAVSTFLTQQLAELKSLNTALVNNGIPVIFLAVERSSNSDLWSKMEGICESRELADVLSIVVVDSGIPIDNLSLLVWYAVSSIDPKRDIKLVASEYSSRAKVLINATRKVFASDNFARKWPNVAVMDDKTIQNIDSMWNMLNSNEFICSPSKMLKQMVLGGTSVATITN